MGGGGGRSAVPEAPETAQYSRREQRGWYMYDWANSAFASTVVTLFFGPYLTSVAKHAVAPDGFLHLLGLRIDPLSYWSYVASLAVGIQVLVLPLAGAVADYGQRKRELLAGFTYAGVAATVAMYWLQGDHYLLGAALFLIANTFFGCGVVMYNAFLPEITGPDDRDAVSSRGWGIGYLGGGVLLVLNLLLYNFAERLGISETTAVRVSLASAGVWWGLFTLIPLATLRNRGAARQLGAGEGLVGAGFRQLFHTLTELRKYPLTVLFLIGYLTYNDAIQTVIMLATQFGQEELHLPMATLTQTILMVQFVAFAGAILFGKIAAKVGAKKAVLGSLAIWTGTLVYIYVSVTTAWQFVAMAAVVALVMGGSQALSRSLFSLLVPKGKEAEYFGLYEISDKGTSWLGPLVFGLANQITRSYRAAILSLIVFFVVGAVLLAKVDIRKAAAEAGNEAPELV
jgi:MFS transporter, UMF1 family